MLNDERRGTGARRAIGGCTEAIGQNHGLRLRPRSQVFRSSFIIHHCQGARNVIPVLHRPPDLRRGPVDRDHDRRAGVDLRLAGGAVSGDRAADGPGLVHLRGGQRQGRGRHGGRADRAAGQRRREHALHVVAMHQRRRVQPDGDLQARCGPEHGPGARAEPGGDRDAGAPRRGQADRRGHEEEVAQHHAGRQPGVARRPLRSALPEQLRHDPHQGRAGPAGRSQRRGLPRPAGLRDAGVAGPRQARRPQHDRRRRGRGAPGAERPGRGRADRPGAGPSRAGVPVPLEHSRPASRARAVRRHRRQDRDPRRHHAT